LSRRKQDKQGRVISPGARLVAPSFPQRPGVRLNKTFAPVAEFVLIQTITAVAARHGLIPGQADVDKAYLAEDLYMKVPGGVASALSLRSPP
jgi:hypothetical protein